MIVKDVMRYPVIAVRFEPCETESIEALDASADALLAIAEEGVSNTQIVQSALTRRRSCE